MDNRTDITQSDGKDGTHSINCWGQTGAIDCWGETTLPKAILSFSLLMDAKTSVVLGRWQLIADSTERDDTIWSVLGVIGSVEHVTVDRPIFLSRFGISCHTIPRTSGSFLFCLFKANWKKRSSLSRSEVLKLPISDIFRDRFRPSMRFLVAISEVRQLFHPPEFLPHNGFGCRFDPLQQKFLSGYILDTMTSLVVIALGSSWRFAQLIRAGTPVRVSPETPDCRYMNFVACCWRTCSRRRLYFSSFQIH